MDRLTVQNNGKPCYEIVFTQDFSGLADLISSLGFAERRIAVITDSNVAPLYLDEVMGAIASLPGDHCSHTLQAGEEYKQLSSVEAVYETLIRHHFDRHDLLIALGGGVCGDMTGFAAATYLRGISFLQIPTTLLAQCDSSIGGKTGVDLKGYKNMVGAFHMPRLVYMNLKTLLSLDDRQFLAGFAEVIKHGMIRDAQYFTWLLDHRDEILSRDIGILSQMIRRSCEIKRAVVEEDPTEQGLRAILNFGHTIGHAVEKFLDFTLYHGECVSLGMAAAAAISVREGLLAESEGNRIIEGLRSFGLPVARSFTEEETDRILVLVRSDKKADGKQVRFVYLNGIGNAVRKEISEESLRFGILSLSER